jgi:YD repeat-containing protein
VENCRGCGSLLDRGHARVGGAVDGLRESTRPADATRLGRECPLCGQQTAPPVFHRKSVQFALLVALLGVASLLVLFHYLRGDTERQQAAQQALQQLEASPEVTRHLGSPIAVAGELAGQVKEDETGWQEVRLTIPVRGPRAEGTVQVVGGRTMGAWRFTTLDVVIASERKRVDLVAGRIVELDREAYVEVHTQAAASPEYIQASVPPPRWSGEFPCVWAVADGTAPQLGECAPSVPIAALRSGPVDRFEVDLRFGKFVLRQTDLLLEDGELRVPLTRTYASYHLWTPGSPLNAFGVNSLHDFDIAPMGSRNPYTDLSIVLPDGDFLYHRRISRGGGYADAVYQHSETSTSFYKATTRWDGTGWETRLSDGSLIHFPESYGAKNHAQGAPVAMVDASGNRIELLRDRQRNLLAVRTPGGRRLAFDYDGRGCVVRAGDDGGRSVRYRYSPDGMLTDVEHPGGRARRYAYAGKLLTEVRDERGRVLVRNWYDEAGRVVRQVHAGGETYLFRYRMGANRYYVEEATVVLPGGTSRSVPTADSVTQLVKEIRS